MSAQKAIISLVKNHIERGYLKNPGLGKGFFKVPVDEAIPENVISEFFKDKPVLIYEDKHLYRTLSAPHMISIFLSMLELEPADKILMLGSKGGYMEAVMASLVDEVILIEEYPQIAKLAERILKKLGTSNVTVKCGNPILGCPAEGPFTKVLFTGAVKEVPSVIFDQLAIHGIVVAPVEYSKDDQQVLQFIKGKEGIETNNYGAVSFQELYHTAMDNTVKTRQPVQAIRPVKRKSKSFVETVEEMPEITIEDLEFSTKSKQMTLNPDEPAYILNIKLCNNSDSELIVQVKLETTSLQKDDIGEKIKIKKRSKQVETKFLSNPKREGTHPFKVVVLNPEGLRLNYVIATVEIKKPTWKKILELGLSIVSDSAAQAIAGKLGSK